MVEYIATLLHVCEFKVDRRAPVHRETDGGAGGVSDLGLQRVAAATLAELRSWVRLRFGPAPAACGAGRALPPDCDCPAPLPCGNGRLESRASHRRVCVDGKNVRDELRIRKDAVHGGQLHGRRQIFHRPCRDGEKEGGRAMVGVASFPAHHLEPARKDRHDQVAAAVSRCRVEEPASPGKRRWVERHRDGDR